MDGIRRPTIPFSSPSPCAVADRELRPKIDAHCRTVCERGRIETNIHFFSGR